jgi:hypothetical protein
MPRSQEGGLAPLLFHSRVSQMWCLSLYDRNTPLFDILPRIMLPYLERELSLTRRDLFHTHEQSAKYRVSSCCPKNPQHT